MLKRVRFGLGICLALFACVARAQDFRATLHGTVTDPSGAGIPGASVIAKNVDMGVERSTTAADTGRFVFQFLPIGNYSLWAKAPGFKTGIQEGIRLELAANVRVDIPLPLGEAAEQITVTAEVSGVQTDTSDLSTNIVSEIKENLPLKGRSSLFMFGLAPGVVSTRYWEDARPNDTATNVSFASSGAPNVSNDVSVDGVINTVNVDRGLNIASWVPAVDSVAEYKLHTGSLPAEFGRSGGTIMSLVIKSGTNDPHGSLYYFHQNSALNANNFFSRGQDQKLTAFASHNWGGTFGGPVYIPKAYNGRNRTFFFFSYEEARERQGQSHTSSLPTPRMRTGDFSEVPRVIYDPFSVRLVNGVPARDPFPGKVIPATGLDPVARKMMEFLPLPNTASADPNQPWVRNWTFSFKWPRDFDMYALKLDHVFSEAYNTFFRFNIGKGFFDGWPYQFDGIATPGRNIVTRPHRGFSWGNNVLLNPRTTLDVRLGFAYGAERNRPWSDGFDLTSLGFPSPFVNLVQSRAFPTVSISGFQGMAGSGYVESPGYTWSLQSSLSRMAGPHLVKLGGDIRLIYGNYFTNGAPSGSFSFNEAWTAGPRADTPAGNTGFPVASFLVGLGSGSIPTNNALSIINKYYALFLQDDYRVTRNLTLNLGLRYEYETPRTERYDRTTRGFDRTAPSPLKVPGLDLRGGLVYAGIGGQPRDLYDLDRNNFAPRIGFAYKLLSKTVVRGGYGLHYIPVVQSVEPAGFSVTTPLVASEDGITPKNRLSNPFPQGLLTPIGNSQGLLTLVGQSISFVEPSDRTPMLHTWNLNIQREVAPGAVAQVGYVGSRGIRLVSGGAWHTGAGEELNQLPPSFLSLGSALLETVDNPFFGIITSGSLAGPRIQRQQLLRPYPQFLGVERKFPAYGNSIYHALQAKLETRTFKGATFIVAYTFAKFINDIARIQNAYDRRWARSISANDVPHRFTITGSYDLPIGRNRRYLASAPRALDLLAGGWTISTYSTFQSGFGTEFGVSRSTIFAAGAGPQYPNVVGDPLAGITGSHVERLDRFFNTEAFAQPPNFTFGNAGTRISSVRTPGIDNINLTLTKQFPVTERVRVHLRGSSFNLFNHPVFSGPNTTFGTGNFGKVFSQANLSRQTELALRIVF